jgi:hypothetical protein
MSTPIDDKALDAYTEQIRKLRAGSFKGASVTVDDLEAMLTEIRALRQGQERVRDLKRWRDADIAAAIRETPIDEETGK